MVKNMDPGIRVPDLNSGLGSHQFCDPGQLTQFLQPLFFLP